MPTKTTTPDPEALAQRAADLHRQAAEAQAQLQRAAQEELKREREAQRKADEETVRRYDRGALDRGVREAQQAFEDALAEQPIVQAFADYITSQYRRSHAHLDAASAHGRLDLPGDGPRQPDTAQVPLLQEVVARVADRLAMQQIDTERVKENKS